MNKQQRDNEIRLGLRKQLMAGGVPPQHVDEITDIAIHAAASAEQAIFDVLQRCSSPEIWLTAIGPAVSIAKAHCDHIEQAVRQQASVAGLRTSDIAFTVGGPQ